VGVCESGKDNFWTTNVTDNPYQKGSATPKNPGSNVELNTIAAVLSTGPVGISDKIGATNATLIMRTCDANGRLLQPSKPLTPSERMYTEIGQAGFCSTCRGGLPQTGSDGELWSSYSAVKTDSDRSVMQWLTVGARIGCHGSTNCDTHAPLPLSKVDLYPMPAADQQLLHRYWHSSCPDGADAIASGCILRGVPNMVSTNRSSGTDDFPFDLILSHPVSAASPWILLGELGKYTTLSRQRFTSVKKLTKAGIDLELAGAVGEVVTVTALHRAATTGSGPNAAVEKSLEGFTVVVKTATIGAHGSATLHFFG
jgi:hypothetical protein